VIKKAHLFMLIMLLCSCGGSGPSVAPVAPIASNAYDYSEGSASTEVNADNAIVNSSIYTLPYVAPDGTVYGSVAQAKQSLNGGGDFVATTDTNARQAWRQGWTGKNVKVGVADKFNSNGQVDVHGDWVALVVSSVAPEHTVAFRDVLSSTSFAGFLGDVNSANAYFESNGYHIVNNSWGIERALRDANGAYTGALDATFDNLVASTVAAYDVASESAKQGLYVFAGGNGGQFCPTRRIENCSWTAAVQNKLRENGYDGASNIIFVGSLDDGTNNLAGYSYFAGNLAYDFIVTYDDLLGPSDAAGTSFAAARVSGAAAIVKQKFPNLSSGQIKQVLLQTADDLGAPGVDETFGYGKLNILNSLSPQGVVVPK